MRKMVRYLVGEPPWGSLIMQNWSYHADPPIHLLHRFRSFNNLTRPACVRRLSEFKKIMVQIALSKYLKRSVHFVFYTVEFALSPRLLWTKNVISCKTQCALNLDNYKPAFQVVFFFFAKQKKKERLMWGLHQYFRPSVRLSVTQQQ